MTTQTNSPVPGADQIFLLSRKEVAVTLRLSGRTIEEQTKKWERSKPVTGQPQPSSPLLGLRPTRLTPKTVLYDLRDVREYLANARLEQEGKPAASHVEVEQ